MDSRCRVSWFHDIQSIAHTLGFEGAANLLCCTERDRACPRVTRMSQRASGRKVGGGIGVVEELTAVEREIVRLVADGKSNTKIGAILELSPRTVETYRLRLMRKIGVENLPALVKYAIRNGITTLD